MASTYSDLKVELIGTGEQSGTWGVTTNTNLSVALGEAITGSADVTFASANATITLTDTNGSQAARNLRLNLTGTSSGTHYLILGSGCNIEKLYLINNTLGNAVIVQNTAGGTGVTVPASKSMFVYNTGTNVVDAVTHLTSLSLTNDLAVADGGTGSSTLTAENVILGNGTNAVKFVAPGSNGNVLTSNGTTWVSTAPSGGVTTFSAGTTGLTPNSASNGAITLGGTLAIGSGGTGATTDSGARTNLGLGTIATQNSNNVSITGGTISGITDLAVADGGTGSSTLTAENVILGNGTSAVKFVAPGTNGNVLRSNGTTWTSAAPPAGGFTTFQIYTSGSGSWTIPTSITACKITVIGGGGAGSGNTGTGSNATDAGAGGGGGGAAIRYYTGLTPGNTINYTVGGATGTSSVSSGSQSITTISATGGTNAQGVSTLGTNGLPGLGGTGSGGDINLNGMQGWGAEATQNAVGGSGGGAGIYSNGALGITTTASNQRFNGNAGSFGGGGSGGCRRANSATYTGGAGGNGVVIIEYQE